MFVSVFLFFFVLACKSVNASESDFFEMQLSDIMDDMVLSDDAMDEIIHPKRNRWIKPHFDVDDKTCNVTRDYLYNNQCSLIF